MTSSTKNVKLGVCQAFYDGVDLGYTQGGVESTVKTDTHKTTVDQFGKTAISEQIIGRECSVKLPLAETTLENMVTIMPGATMTTVGGSVASGSITVATLPTAGETVIVNGKTMTFKANAVTDGDVALGATVAACAANLTAALQASTDPLVAIANYAVDATASAKVDITYGNPWIYPSGKPSLSGNSFTLAAGTAGAAVTLSGATLAGGADPTSQSIDVPTGIGTDLLDQARELRLHPINKAAGDYSEDFVIPLAATPGALTFAYQLEKERIYNVDFTAYPDVSNGGRLYRVGVPPA